MGAEKRMGGRSDVIRLYSQQAGPVLEVLKRDGVCFSKEEYVKKKYGESAPIFLTAYRWFVEKAEGLVPKPKGAEFPYWAFQDLYSVDGSGGHPPLVLEVPRDQAVFFDMYDWNKIMRLQYIGETEAEEKAFKRELVLQGLREDRIMLTDFYPQWKQKIMESWDRLFRYHEGIKSGDNSGVKSVQAGLWQIKEEWTVSSGKNPQIPVRCPKHPETGRRSL